MKEGAHNEKSIPSDAQSAMVKKRVPIKNTGSTNN